MTRPTWTLFPTPRLAGVTVATSVLWLLPPPAAIVAPVVTFLLVLAVLADALALPGPASILIERAAPDTLGLGDSAPVRYTVTSGWPWITRGEVDDELPDGVEGGVRRRGVMLVPREPVSVDTEATGTRRGRYAWGRVAISLRSPVGFVRRIVRRELTGEVVVVPSLSGIRGFRLLSLQHRLSDVGIRALRQRGEGGAFAGLRDYVPGDDPRLVDWKATARHRRMITREETVERSQAVIIAVDCGRAMTQLVDRFSRFEHVLSAALLLGEVASTGGDRVGLLAFDHRMRAVVPPQRPAAALRHLRTALAGLDASMSEPDYAAAFRTLALEQRRRALVVLFTDVVETRAAASLVAYASRAARRHALVLVALQNDALLAAARPASNGTLALYHAAAAEELLHEREAALARIRQAGVIVLDVPPTRMAVAVVNQYLEIKARGQL